MTTPDEPPITPSDDSRDGARLRERLEYDDRRLLAECHVDIYRASGPGGQHRNKVSSAVRLRHQPTGFVVTATERRSQHENKTNALSRLREAIAIGIRRPPPEEVAWPATVQIHQGRLKVNPKNPAYWEVLALALDELLDCAGQIAKAAGRLNVSTSSFTKFLAEHDKAWTEANQIRGAFGLGPLKR